MNCCTDALVCPATTDIPRHDSVNICVAGIWIGHQESGSRHYLTGLAIAALDHVEIEPGLLQRPSLLRGVDRFYCRNSAVADATDRRDARSSRCAVDMHGAGAAYGNTAAEFGAGHAEHVAQHPEQRRIAVDIDRPVDAVDLDRRGHSYLRGIRQHFIVFFFDSLAAMPKLP